MSQIPAASPFTTEPESVEQASKFSVEVWQKILGHVSNSGENRSTLQSLLLSSKAVRSNTITTAERKLLATRLDELAQRMRAQVYSPQNLELFNIILDAVTQPEFPKNRIFSDAEAIYASPTISLESAERVEVAMVAATLVRTLPPVARLDAFNQIIAMINADDGAWGHAPGHPMVKGRLAVLLASQIGYLPAGVSRLSGFSGIAEAISRFADLSARNPAISALAAQLHHVVIDDNPDAQFDHTAAILRSMTDLEMQTATGIALAKQVAEPPLQNAVGRFGRVAWLIENMTDPEAKAKIATALIGNIRRLPVGQARVDGFNHACELIKVNLEAPREQANTAAALAVQLRDLPEESRAEKFDELAAIVVPLPFPGKIQATVSLAGQIRHVPGDDDRTEKFNRIIRLMGITPKIEVAVALAEQLQHFSRQTPDGRNPRLEKFNLLSGMLHTLADEPGKASLAAALALQLRHLDPVHTTLADRADKASLAAALALRFRHLDPIHTLEEKFHELAAVKDGMSGESARAAIAAALVQQVRYIAGDRGTDDSVDRLFEMMDGLTDAAARSRVAAALATQTRYLTDGGMREQVFEKLVGIMDDLAPPTSGAISDSTNISPRARIAVALANQLSHLEAGEKRITEFRRLAVVMDGSWDTSDEHEMFFALALQIQHLPDGQPRIDAFNDMTRTNTIRTDPDGKAFASLASQFRYLPEGEPRVNAFILLANTINISDHTDSARLAARSLTYSIHHFSEGEARVRPVSHIATIVGSLGDPDGLTVMTLAGLLRSLRGSTGHASAFQLVFELTRELADGPDKTDSIGNLVKELRRLPGPNVIAGFNQLVEIIENLSQPGVADEMTFRLAKKIKRLDDNAVVHGFNRVAAMLPNMTGDVVKGQVISELLTLIERLPANVRLAAFNNGVEIIDGLTVAAVKELATVRLANQLMHLAPEGLAAGFDQVTARIEAITDPERTDEAIAALAHQIVRLRHEDSEIRFNRVLALLDGPMNAAGRQGAAAILASQLIRLTGEPNIAAFNRIAGIIEESADPALRAASVTAMADTIRDLPRDLRVTRFNRLAAMIGDMTPSELREQAADALEDSISHLPEESSMDAFSRIIPMQVPLQ